MPTRLKSLTCFLLMVSQFTFLFVRVAAAQTTRRSKPKTNEPAKGLQLKLSEGASVEERPAPVNAPPASRLSDAETENVLKRLRPIKNETIDELSFAIRDRSLPPPRTGKTVSGSFPPSEERDAPEIERGPLEVLRYSPEGDVPLVPQLSVTFSQPMVAITSHQDAIAAGVPVRLTPQPRGRWRWVGTKTILFETEGHFPMATEYTAEIPAGTKSITGGVLSAATVWKFTTPPPQVKSSYPKDIVTARDPLMFVEFDQRINRSEVADKIVARSGNRQWKTRLATSEEIDEDDTTRRLAASAGKDRWLAFRIINSRSADAPALLPPNSSITVTVPAGTPSAEGPRSTTEPYSFSFKTYGLFRVTEHECARGHGCSPFDSWTIDFSNPIDESSFEQSQVQVHEIAANGKGAHPVTLKSEVYGTTLAIHGVKRGRTSYRVTFDPSMRDRFGQTLGQAAPIFFNVGTAMPALTGPDRPFVVLDPQAPPRLSVYSVNHTTLRARFYSVGPEHWGQFVAYLRNRDRRAPRTPPGRLALSKVVSVQGRPDQMAETGIDLSPVLNGSVGQIIVTVEENFPFSRRYRPPVVVWTQVTQIGLDAFVDHSKLIGWATSLKDGKPIESATLSLGVTRANSHSEAVTGADGVAHINLPKTNEGPSILVARKGRDIAILPEDGENWGDRSNWVKNDPGSSLRWFVFDDRRMYRPGEEVHLKGWIRKIGDGKDGDVGLLDSQSKVEYSVKDSRGNEILKGDAGVNALGGFDTSFKLPATMNLGYAYVRLEAQGNLSSSGHYYHHQFQVQEFRRPEFEVTAQASEGPHFVGANATATVNAAYYAGGGLANAEVNWRVTASTARFTPPNRDDFTFGKWIPWWIQRYSNDRRVETFKGTTDAAGKHVLRMDFASVNPPEASTVTVEARVTDVNRQAWAATTSLLVHPADLYVGLRSARTFVQKGEPLIVQSIVADLDGKLIAGRDIKMRAVLMDWVFEKGEWKQQEKNPQECTVTSAGAPAECRFETKEGGEYRVSARIEDDKTRKNESELTLWAAGGRLVPQREVEQETAQLIPDRKEYHAGDTAEILVQAPFYPAEGVLTLRRSGLVRAERFKMDGPSHTLRIQIDEGYTPNVRAQVDLVGATVRADDEGKPQDKLPCCEAVLHCALD